MIVLTLNFSLITFNTQSFTSNLIILSDMFEERLAGILMLLYLREKNLARN